MPTIAVPSLSAQLQATIASTTDEGKVLMLQKQLSAGQACLASLSEDKLDAAGLEPLRDPLSAWLDKERGSSVEDLGIFLQLTQEQEKAYFEDMRALNVGFTKGRE